MCFFFVDVWSSISLFQLLSFQCFVSKIRNDLQKGLQQYEETTSQTLLNHEQRVNNLRVDLNLLEEQINQRMTHVSLELSRAVYSHWNFEFRSSRQEF